MNNISEYSSNSSQPIPNTQPLTIVVGAVGGLGMTTSNIFIAELEKDCRAIFGQTCKTILVCPNIDCAVEQEAIRKGTIKPFLPLLIDSAQTLEQAGATIIIVLCNTLNTFGMEIQNAINIPFVSIVQTACEHIQALNYKKVGVIGTVATKENGLYRTPFKKMGIGVVEPTTEEQELVGKAIHRLVKGKTRGNEKRIITAVIDRMKADGAESILLACTDLQIVITHNPDNNIFDTLALLEERVITILKTGIIPPKLSQ